MFTWNWSELVHSKVFWTSICAIIAAIGAVVLGEIELGAAIELIIAAIFAIFFRDAIAKSGPTVK